MVLTVIYADHDRTRWYPANPRTGRPAGDPITRNSAGSPRPAMPIPLDVFVVHYVGAGRTWLDTGDTADELAAIERDHAIPSGKPNEYNSASDSAGETWGYAGPYQAAHSAGENFTRWGHLVVHGLEQPTDIQARWLIAGVRHMRRQLVAAGYLTPDHRVEPHRHQPGAETTCPGPLFDNRVWWERITAPLDDPTTPPTTGDEMNTPLGRFYGHADQFLLIPISAETKARLNPAGDAAVPIVFRAVDPAALERQIGYKLTPMPGER